MKEHTNGEIKRKRNFRSNQFKYFNRSPSTSFKRICSEIHTGFLTQIQKSDSSSLNDPEELDDFEEYDED